MAVVLRVIAKTAALAMLGFTVAYLILGFHYGYLWSASSPRDGQAGLGRFLAVLYSSVVGIAAGLISLARFAYREFKKAKNRS